jgi:flagellar biosynthesis/type III secretory pathway protein FliH
MSSFRPLIEREAPRFIPLPRLGVLLSGGGTDALDADFSSVAHPEEPANFDAIETAESVMPVEADAERIAAIEAEAYARGRSESRLEADRLEAVCSTLEAAAAELVERADREDVAWRELVLGLSMSIARRWIGRELKSEPEAFMAMLGRALERLPEPRVARLCLASETLARLDEQRPQWRDVLSSGRTLDIEADPGLDASEYRIEGSEGVVDGRVAVLLADLEAVLSDSLGDAAEEGA